jgi:hypothetical protein
VLIEGWGTKVTGNSVANAKSVETVCSLGVEQKSLFAGSIRRKTLAQGYSLSIANAASAGGLAAIG